MWGWLPKVYYDFMARIVPGAIVVLGLVYLRHGPVRGVGFVMRVICEQENAWLCRLGVGLLVSYLVGLVIGEFGDIVAGRLLERRDTESELMHMRECLDDHNRSMEALGVEPRSIVFDRLPGSGMMTDQLAVVDAHMDGRLMAVRAERRLCLVTALGMFVLAIGNLLLLGADLVPKRLLVEGLLLLTMLVLWRRSTRLHERSVKETCSAWLMRFGWGGGPEA